MPRLLTMLGLALIASGCAAGPRAVMGMRSQGNKILLLYSRQGTDERGVVECVVPPSGDVAKCHHLPVEFEESP